MNTLLDQLQEWMESREDEHLEFKDRKNRTSAGKWFAD